MIFWIQMCGAGAGSLRGCSVGGADSGRFAAVRFGGGCSGSLRGGLVGGVELGSLRGCFAGVRSLMIVRAGRRGALAHASRSSSRPARISLRAPLLAARTASSADRGRLRRLGGWGVFGARCARGFFWGSLALAGAPNSGDVVGVGRYSGRWGGIARVGWGAAAAGRRWAGRRAAAMGDGGVRCVRRGTKAPNPAISVVRGGGGWRRGGRRRERGRRRRRRHPSS